MIIWYKTILTKAFVPQRTPTLALHTIGSFDELDPGVRRRYSLMKHGDRSAARGFALELENLLIANVEPSELVLTSVPNNNPIPIQEVIDVVYIQLLVRGFLVDKHKIDITDPGQPGQKNYGTMSYQDRVNSTASKRLYLPPEKEPLLKGKRLMLIDDLRATGNTEAYCARHLESCPLASFGFTYLVKFTDGLAMSRPETEEDLNRAYVRVIEDLHPTVQTGWVINERAVRFVLNLAPEPGIHDLGEEEKTRSLLDFLHSIPIYSLLELFHFSQKAAFRQPHYAKALNLLRQTVEERAAELSRALVTT